MSIADGSDQHESSTQLSKQELWDLLQATDAELRSRLVQAECQRDHYAQQLLVIQNQSAQTCTQSHSNIYNTPDYCFKANETQYQQNSLYKYDVSQSNLSQFHQPPYTQTYSNNVSNVNVSIETPNDYSRSWATNDVKLDVLSSRKSNDDVFSEKISQRSYNGVDRVKPSNVTKNRSENVLSDSLSFKDLRSFRHSCGNIPNDNSKSESRNIKKRKRSRSRRRVQSCTSSSSDSTLGASYPITRKAPPFAITPKTKALSIEESSDSEINIRRIKERRALRRRDKYRSCSSQPETSHQKSDPNIKESQLQSVSSKSMYGHVFRSLPDVENVRDDDCTTIATEFVYSHTSLHVPYDKAEDTETGEFDDLSFVDIPAPKFDDSSSNEDYVKSEINYRDRYNLKQPCSNDSIYHHHPVYNRYPQYSGMFHQKDEGRGRPARQTSSERKSMEDPDLSPLPILRSLHKQQSQHKEQQRRQKQEEEDKKAKQLQRQWIDSQAYRSCEGTFVIKDGSSLVSRIPNKKSEKSLRSYKSDSSQIVDYADTKIYAKTESIPTKATYTEIYKAPKQFSGEDVYRESSAYRSDYATPRTSSSSNRDQHTKKHANKHAPSLVSHSMDDSYVHKKNYTDKRDMFLPINKQHPPKQFRNYSVDDRGMAQMRNNSHQSQRSDFTRKQNSREDSSYFKREVPFSDHIKSGHATSRSEVLPKSEGLYSSNRHPLLYRDEIPSIKSNQIKHETSPLHSYTSVSRERLSHRSRATSSRGSSMEQSNNGASNGGMSMKERKGSGSQRDYGDNTDHETTTKV